MEVQIDDELASAVQQEDHEVCTAVEKPVRRVSACEIAVSKLLDTAADFCNSPQIHTQPSIKAVEKSGEDLARHENCLSQELAEEKRKSCLLMQHVQELEKMVEECTKHGQEIVKRNSELQEEISAMRSGDNLKSNCPERKRTPSEGTGGSDTPPDIENNAQMKNVVMENEFLLERVSELEKLKELLDSELQNQRRENSDLLLRLEMGAKADKSKAELGIAGSTVGGGSGGTAGDALELEALVDELQRQNKTLELQLAHSQNLMIVSSATSEKSTEQINHLREEILVSEQQQGETTNSLVELAEKNDHLKCECELLQIRVTCAMQSESNSKRQSQETLRDTEQMHHRFSELEYECRAATEAQQQARRSAEESDSRLEEMQRRYAKMEDIDGKMPKSANPAFDQEGLSIECERLRLEVASAATTERDVCNLVAELKDKVSKSIHSENEAQRLAEERLHRCQFIERKLSETEHNIDSRAEDALTRCRQLQQQVVSATEGELVARRQVEQSLEKNRELMTQCDNLRVKLAESFQGEQGQDLRCECKQLKEELEVMKQQIATEEQNSNSLATIQNLQDRPADGHSLEPEMERSPMLEPKELLGGNPGCSDSQSDTSVGNGTLADDSDLAAEWQARATKEIAARKSAESRLRAAVRGIDQLRPEYEQLREQAMKAVDAEREAHSRLDELVKRNRILQQENDSLHKEVESHMLALQKSSGDELWKCVREDAQGGPSQAGLDDCRQTALRECEALRQKVSIAAENECEVSALAEHLRAQMASVTQNEQMSRDLEEQKSRECELLAHQCESLQNELFESQTLVQLSGQLRHDAALSQHRCNELEVKCEGLQHKLTESSRRSCSIGPLLEDAVAVEALHRCEELERECERLRNRPARVSVQPLLEDAVAVEAVHRCEELERECEQLRKRLRDKKDGAPAEDGSLETELWSCLEEGLRRGRNSEPSQDCERLRRELAAATHAESEAQKAQVASAKLTEKLQGEISDFRIRIRRHEEAENDALQRCRALQEESWSQVEATCLSNQEAMLAKQELQKLREQAACATEAERAARRSAEAASQLMRRKEELRQCKQAREQMSRAVHAEKEARRSAEAAIDLKRLIKDLGFADVSASSSTRSVSSLSASSSSPRQPADVVSQGGKSSKVLSSPTFGGFFEKC